MTAWVADTLVALTLLMLLVLALRRPVASLFGAGWAYALWLLPALRLILPPLPQDLLPANTALLLSIEGGAGQASLPAGQASLAPLMLALWAGGALMFLVWQWLTYRELLRGLGVEARPAAAGNRRAIPIVSSETAEGPLAIGLFDRRIVVPADFALRYNESERRLAVAHELVHHRRGDIWWNVAALGLLALNWFNPVAWIAFRAFRTDQELACDAAVTAAAPLAERHDYARALVKSASRPGLIAACPFNHADQLKRRLKMMKQHRTTKLRSFGGAAAFVTLLVGGLGLSSAVAGTAPEASPAVEKVIIIEKRGEGKGLGDPVKVMRLNGIEEACLGEKTEVNAGGDGDAMRTRLIFCGHPGLTPAQRAEKLEQVRGRLAQNDALDAEHRTKVEAALAAEIGRLRAGGE